MFSVFSGLGGLGGSNLTLTKGTGEESREFAILLIYRIIVLY